MILSRLRFLPLPRPFPCPLPHHLPAPQVTPLQQSQSLKHVCRISPPTRICIHPFSTTPTSRILRPHFLLLTSTLRRPLFSSTPIRRRTLNTTTKAWLRQELILACKIIVYGTLAIGVGGAIIFFGLHTYHESKQPTPSTFPYRARLALHSARHAAEWDNNPQHSAGYLAEAISLLDGELQRLGGWSAVDDEWKRGYVDVLMRLGQLEEAMGYEKRAMGRWSRVLEVGLLGGVDLDKRIKAATRLGCLVDEFGDMGRSEVEEDEEAVKKREKEDEEFAEWLLRLAYSLSLEEAGLLPPGKEGKPIARADMPGVIPKDITNPTQNLLYTATELGIHYARFERLDHAFPIFLSILRIRTTSPDQSGERGSLSDPCEVGKIMSYLGEVLWTSGMRKKGLDWCRKAVDKTEPLVELRAACRDCAVHAARNEVVMLQKLANESSASDEGREKKGWSLWRRSGSGKEKKEDGVVDTKEWKEQLEAAEERLKRLQAVRVTKGK